MGTTKRKVWCGCLRPSSRWSWDEDLEEHESEQIGWQEGDMKGRWIQLVIRNVGNSGKCLGKDARTSGQEQMTNLKEKIGNPCEWGSWGRKTRWEVRREEKVWVRQTWKHKLRNKRRPVTETGGGVELGFSWSRDQYWLEKSVRLSILSHHLF